MKYINKIKEYLVPSSNSYNDSSLVTPLIQSQQIKNDPNFTFIVNILNTNHQPQRIKPNAISTSKYTTFNFLPKILFEQFSKVVNIYFLIIAFFQMIKEISNSGGKPVILLPLAIVVSINGAKDFYEDWKRKKSDEEENEKKVYVYNKQKKDFEVKKWDEITEGDIVKVNDNEYFPADCIVIKSTEPNGVCYIETKSIDGETNFKVKRNNAKLAMIFKDDKEEDMFKKMSKCYIMTQEPNELIYNFNAKFFYDNINSNNGRYSLYSHNRDKKKDNYAIIENESFILRGCSLKQTKYVYAIVIYVGHDTKIMKNSPSAKAKTSRVEFVMNHQIFLVFALQIFLSLISAVVSMIQFNTNISSLSYILPSRPMPQYHFSISFFIARAGTWLVLINNIVPISLLVTLEMVKYIQGMFISWDIELYDRKTRTPAIVQTSTLNEELGQVKFVFSDKTGTLTKNHMVFKAMSVGNYIYGVDDDRIDDDKDIIANDEYGLITNFDMKSKTFMKHLKDSSHENYHNIDLFLTTLAICHTVIVDQKQQPKIIYQASSPDESAMVNCARYYNYIFSGRDVYNNLYIKTSPTNQSSYNILNIIEYTSERKRMSVIAKCPDGKIRLFAKGADSVISERLAPNSSVGETNKHLIKFAQKGLRTLMIAYREVGDNEYNKFDEEYRTALSAIDKETAMKNAIDSIEKNILLLGATAIEDELQDDVSDVLKSFIETGIKVWVLTGDKMDTAKSIAFSCQLISHEFFIFEFPENSSYEIISLKLKEFSKEYYLSEGEQKKFALIVSLNELNKILNDTSLTNLFYSLSIHCNSVLCCRVTPKQKALMVSLIKDRQPNITTLAIGDGANDVNMITTANIGIGIIGVEGRQAARASDYAIGQFKFIKRLLFVHGRESYRKNSFIVCYNFYKNVLFVIPHFWFGFVSHFSGQYLYDPWLYQIFNIIFASFPIIWFGIYDKEVSYDILMKDRRYYTQGIVGKLFHSSRFWKWIIYGILQASFIYIFSFYANESNGNRSGNVNDLDASGSIAYSGVVVIVNLKILLTTCTHTVISVGLFVFSTGAYYLILYIMSRFPFFYNFNNFSMISHGWNFYLSTLCLVIICAIIDVGTGTFLRIYGWVADPLSLRPEEFEPRVEMEEIIKEKNELNNKFTGSAFAQQENQTIAMSVNNKKMYINE